MKKLFVGVFVLFGCGGTEIIEPETIPDGHIENKAERYCGDYNCDEDLGEDYWNCMDCVDLYTGGPKNGYCGDGICFNESMTSCWTDCRPDLLNPDPYDPLSPEPKPWPSDKPIPLPFPEPL